MCKQNSLDRQTNYDLLRIISAVAVIIDHVSGSYINKFREGFLIEYIDLAFLYNIISKFAVPCFIMLSGAFLLTNTKNREYKFFYKKTFKKIGIPTIVFSILYFGYGMVKRIGLIVLRGKEYKVLLEPIKALVTGQPYYHMWYLFMMFGIYLLVPILIRIRQDMGESCFKRLAVIYLPIACLSEWTSVHLLKWDLGSTFCFLGYFMAGYVIRKSIAGKKSNKKGIFLLLLGVCVVAIEFWINHFQIIHGARSTKYFLESQCSPFNLVLSVLIFAGISYINVQKSFGRLPTITFFIYLFHAGVLDVLWMGIRRVFGVTGGDGRGLIPICISIVFFVSLLCSMLYIRIWNILEKRYNISDRICVWVEHKVKIA